MSKLTKQLPTVEEYHDYGVTCPLLKIARKYQVPYELTLALADRYQHGRLLSEHVIAITKSISRRRMLDVAQACKWVSNHTIDLRAGLAQ